MKNQIKESIPDRGFFAVAASLIAGYIAIVAAGLTVLSASQNADEHQNELNVLHQVQANVTDAETNQRGYLLTGESDYLSASRDSLKRLETQVTTIRTQHLGEILTPRDWTKLDNLITQKTREMRITIAQKQAGKDAAVLETLRTNDGKDLMDQIRAQISALEERGQHMLASDRERTAQLMILTSLIGAISLIISLWAIDSSSRRIRTEASRSETAIDEAQAQRQLLSVTLGSIGDAVIVTDLDARVTFMNSVATALTGWSNAESVGQLASVVFNVISQESREPVESPVVRVLRHGTIVGLANHTLLVQKGGGEIPIKDNGAPILDADGDVVGAVIVFRDFTEQRNSSAELARTRDAAQAASAAKDRFLASLSHELRTPLTPVVAMLSAWETDPTVPPAMIPQIQLMRRNVDLEARLIDDLLDITRITEGKLSLDMDVVDVHKLLEETVEMQRSEFMAKHLTVKQTLIAIHHHVYADRGRLQQVFWNILRNAEKFTPAGGQISLRTRNTPTGVEVRISDSGIGISPDLLNKLFLPFEQGSSQVVRRAGGLGLGLAISNALVALQEGQISASSGGPDQGSCFIVSLPVVAAPRVVEMPVTIIAPERRSVRILLVEDHVDSATVLVMLLKQKGHDVTKAASVAEATALLQTEDWDVLLSDIGLPDGTGIDVIRQARIQFGDRISAIALTGYGMEGDLDATHEAGFDAHLTKPVNISKLESTIQQLVTARLAAT